MSEPNLTPQMPGELPGVDPETVAPLLSKPVVDIVAALPALSDLELTALEILEREGEQRQDVLDVIEIEQIQRLENATNPAAADVELAPVNEIELPPANPDKTMLGETRDYSRMYARDVDVTKLDRPVLTRDGWLLPPPRAQAG